MSTPKTEAAKPFVLSSIKLVDTIDWDVKNPATGQSVGWIWTIAGPTHEKTIAQRTRLTKENAAEARQQKQTRLNGKKVVLPEDDPDANREKNARFYMERVIGWSPVSLDGTADYPFTIENGVKLLLTEEYGWLWDGLIEVFGEQDRFLKISAKT